MVYRSTIPANGVKSHNSCMGERSTIPVNDAISHRYCTGYGPLLPLNGVTSHKSCILYFTYSTVQLSLVSSLTLYNVSRAS